MSGNERVGGLVGDNFGMVNNTYATGNVSGTEQIGGLVGSNQETVKNSFWDIYTTGQSSSSGGIGKSTFRMKDVVTFTHELSQGLEQIWDFVNNPYNDNGTKDIWYIDKNGQINDGYPFLRSLIDLDIEQPTAGAGKDKTVKIGETFTLDASNSHDNVGIKSYNWSLGDGENKKGERVSYFYNNIGSYTVELNVTDYVGNWDNDTLSITVEDDIESPVADAGEDKTVKLGEEFTLDASGSSDNVGIVSYEWDLDNGKTKTGKQVNYTYDKAGKYTVTLTVTDEAGNSATVTKDTIEITVEGSGDESDENFPIKLTTIALLATIVLMASISFVALYRYRKKRR